MDEEGFGLDTPPGARRVSGVSERRRVDRRTGRAGFGGNLRLRFVRSVIPQSTKGRIAGAVAVVLSLGLLAGAGYEGEHYLTHDERFVVPGSAAIQIEGNSHLTRAQLLSVFGEDVDRNIFTVSLAQRRAELERLPWVEHATVMRLLPDHLRISIVERTPVAFVRQGSKIGLVDRSGVLLDMDDDSEAGAGTKGAEQHYSFPVVTGVSEEDPASVRAARMKIYLKFASDLDSSKENISSKLSEVDLSNPEDVKALIPDHGTEILVHFGDTDYLERYRKFEEQLPTWRTQYPKLASADMRYDRQVVLEMQAGAGVPTNNAQTASAADPTPEPVKHAAARPAVKKPVEKPKAHATLAAMGQPHFPDEHPASPKHVVSSKPAKQ